MKPINLVRIIIAWFSKFICKSEGFAITSVNTTLISLIAACIIAYLVFFSTSIQNAKLKVFDEVNKINNILFVVHDCPFRASEKSEIYDKEKLFKIIMHISIFGSNAGKFEVDKEHKELSLPKDVDSLAKKALGAMSCLSGQYPFPVIIYKDEKNRTRFDRESKSIILANLDDVRSWIDSMNKIVRTFSHEFRGSGQLLNLFKEFGKGDFATNRRNSIIESPITGPMLSKPMLRGPGRPFMTLGALDPVFVYHDFMDKMAEAQNIVWSTSNYLRRVDAQIMRYPSNILLSVIFILVIVAFGSGVIYPLIAEKVRRIFALWLPLFIYLVIGVLIFWKIFWH